MATKPYAVGGSYISRMSDHCAGCEYDPKSRTGTRACPFTTLYWDFLARNGERLAGNPRLGRQLASARNLSDIADVRRRAALIQSGLAEGAV